MTTYEQVRDLSLPYLKGYLSDLVKLDREIITNLDGETFLHFTRDYGTHLVVLRKAEDFPARGESVQILFGRGYREDVLRYIVDTVEYWQHPTTTHPRQVLYCPGRNIITGKQDVQQINVTRAIGIIHDYRSQVRMIWGAHCEN